MKNTFLLIGVFFISLQVFSQKNINSNHGIAIKGYDLLSYFEGNPQKGTKVFSTQFNGVTYWFTSREHLVAFKKTPLSYLPQYGGFCAYAMGKSGEKVAVNPKAYLIIDAKLYLFYKNFAMNTLKKWNAENPKKLQLKADKNWDELNKD